MIYMTIERGVLKCLLVKSSETDKTLNEVPAIKAGAVAMGKFLKEKDIRSFQFSSSLDFPLENGGEDIDFTRIISENM